MANLKIPDPEWHNLYTAGGIAALIAGVLFRRNLAAEIGLFSRQAAPATVSGWFALLQQHRLLGLAYLNIFDVVNYVLLILVFLALYAALEHIDKSRMLLATTAALVGIVVYCASNTAFSLLALSDRYAVAATETQRDLLLAAGQALLALDRFSTAAQPGSGGYLSLLLIAVAGLITSFVMLRSRVFNRFTAWMGILAGGLDLAYCIAYVFVPTGDSAKLALYFIPAAGLFWMAWHISIGWRLCRLGKKESRPTAA